MAPNALLVCTSFFHNDKSVETLDKSLSLLCLWPWVTAGHLPYLKTKASRFNFQHHYHLLTPSPKNVSDRTLENSRFNTGWITHTPWSSQGTARVGWYGNKVRGHSSSFRSRGGSETNGTVVIIPCHLQGSTPRTHGASSGWSRLDRSDTFVI